MKVTVSQLYLVAEKLHSNAAGHRLNTKNWIAAIYKSLLVANKGDKEEILWTKYNEWKINHNCRAARSAAKANKSKIISFKVEKIDIDNYFIHATYEEKEKIISNTIVYRKEAFPVGLWKVYSPKNDTVLANANERDVLFRASISEYNNENNGGIDLSLYADLG